MRIKAIFQIVIFSILLLIPLAEAEDSSYSLLVYSNSNVLNPGDLNEIWIFVGGKGKITNNILHIDIPHELVNGYFYCYEPEPLRDKDEIDRYFFNETEYEIKDWLKCTSRYHLPLSEHVFKSSLHCKDLQLSACGFYYEEKPLIAPFNIRFNVGDKTKPGDYVLKFNFYYQDENGWHHDEDTVNIHVNNLYEQYELCFWVAGFLVALFSLILRSDKLIKWVRNNLIHKRDRLPLS